MSASPFPSVALFNAISLSPSNHHHLHPLSAFLAARDVLEARLFKKFVIIVTFLFVILQLVTFIEKDAKNSNGGSPMMGLAATPIPSRPTTPRPSTDAGATFRSGMLTVVIFGGRGLSLPPGLTVPDAIQSALRAPPPLAAHSVQNGGGRQRDSMQMRKRLWWLPYVVLEFDKNEVLIDALDGDLSAPTWNHRAHFDVSRTSTVIVSAYLRTNQSAYTREDMGNDILMARVEIAPVLDSLHVSDQWYSTTGGTGEFHLQLAFKPSAQSLTIEAFDLLKVIGKGSFGKVMQVRKKDTQRVYALKTIRKAHIASRPGEITHILAERTVLALVNNPFIVPLKFSFQTPDKLYLVMSFGTCVFMLLFAFLLINGTHPFLSRTCVLCADS